MSVRKDGLQAAERILLQQVIAGDRDAADPEVAAARARSAPFARELLALLRTRTTLDDAAAEQRAALSRGAAAADQRIAELVRARLTCVEKPSRRRTRSWIWLAAAAALSLLLWPLLHRGQEVDLPLSAGFPVAVDRGYAALRWDCPLPPGWTFRVLVRDPATGREVERQSVAAPEWTPAAPETWPEQVEIVVQQLDQSGSVRDSSARTVVTRRGS